VINNNTPELWDATYATREHWRDFHYVMLLALLPDGFEPKGVLDVGCGLGDGLMLCRKRWPKTSLFGLDFSAVGLATAHRRLPDANLYRRDLNAVDFADGLPRPDLILCSETLEHVNDPDRVLAWLMRAATDTLLVCVPNRGRSTAHHPQSFDEEWLRSRGFETWLRPHPVHGPDEILIGRYVRHG
jgi:trans-aconitate methyltransferase